MSSSAQGTGSSFRSHRIIVASLFLPNTITVVQSTTVTPTGKPARAPATVPAAVKASAPTIPAARKSFPLRSIVDDLKDKATPASSTTSTPAAVETLNPFAKPSLVEPALPAELNKIFAKTSPRRQTAVSRRRSSRSRSSTRDHSDLQQTLDLPTPEFLVEANPHCNGGLKNAVDSVSGGPQPKLRKKLWIGTLGSDFSPPSNCDAETLKRKVSQRLRGEHESEVVWVEDGTFEKMYDGFCHQTLWPALHYAIPDAPKTRMFDGGENFQDYVTVNRAFAQKIKEVWREGDVVWVNDYHLMLLPAMLRGDGGIMAGAPIGFFLHVAFPSSEIFRCFSVREHLLRGLLGSDLIGFQTANYARHFRQTVSRILAVEASPRGIQLGAGFDKEDTGSSSKASLTSSSSITSIAGKGRFVDVGVFPMGIDVWQLKAKRRDPEVAEWVTLLKQRYSGMKILVGRDKLDEIQGVRQKIQAFEIFLDKHPEYVGKVVLIQVALPSPSLDTSTSSSGPGSGSAAGSFSIPPSILTPLSHINSKYSSLTYQPVVFLHTQDVSFSQYLALLTVADGFIVTSLREGMALRTHEFVVVQDRHGEDTATELIGQREGGLILSEFTGTYSYSGFRSCIAINPWDARGTAQAIFEVLTMSDEEAHSRWQDLHHHVVNQTAQAFVTTFLTRCLRANMEHLQAWRWNSTGSSLQGSAYGQLDDPVVQNLNEHIGQVMGRWRHSDRRLVLVDWEGTLVPGGATAFAASTVPDDSAASSAISLLRTLSESKKNEVWLLSGLPVTGVLDRVAKEVPNIGIVAENGCFIKPRPSRGSPSPEWMNMVANFNMTWKTPCLEMLNYFTERTPGSFIEEREASVVWRFWVGPNDDNADRQWARRQAAEAQNHIFDSLGERYGLRIIPGSNSFLVLPTNISRSTAVGAILQLGSQYNSPIHSPVSSYSSSNFSHGRSPSGSSIAFTAPMNPWRMPDPPWMSPDLVETPIDNDDLEFVLAIGADEKLLRRLNELDNAETCSTSAKGTDAKWVLNLKEVANVLKRFSDV
ncbi:glycosyltransferase family 20 protein [Mycena floridula]|nr:glycosyltransferase family 20 protein [Mycena floridula]